MHIERFAPSPTGLLHLGHAYSALCGYNCAKDAKGKFLLRIEDIDQARSKPQFVEAIFQDLNWLGITWEDEVLFQSTRKEAYDQALAQLQSRGLIYGCACTRGDIKAALSARQEGDDALAPYPKICKNKGLRHGDLAFRLDMERAVSQARALSYREIGQGRNQLEEVSHEVLLNMGDIVLARRDIGTSYHLSVVVDDAYQGVTHVTRGEDMEGETPVHVLLQALLELPTPIYRHHKLIRDENHKRLAKRDDARSIARYREQGLTLEDILAMIMAP